MYVFVTGSFPHLIEFQTKKKEEKLDVNIENTTLLFSSPHLHLVDL